MNIASDSRFPKAVVFILLAAITTLISLTIYAAVQQSYRGGANDPQINATEEISSLLAQGAPPEAIVGQASGVDMANSLSLFVIILDKDGKILASSGKLNGKTPELPAGVIDYVKQHGQERFTWQPQKGVRLAAVVRKVDKDGGFVLAARNLREVEKREEQLLKMVGIAWAALILLSGALTWALGWAFGGRDITLVENTEIVAVEPKL